MAPRRHTRSPSPCTRRAEEAPRRQQHGRRASGAPGGVRSRGWRWRACRPECPRRASRRESRAGWPGSPASETRAAAVSEVVYSSPLVSLHEGRHGGRPKSPPPTSVYLIGSCAHLHLVRSVPVEICCIELDWFDSLGIPLLIGRFRLEVYLTWKRPELRAVPCPAVPCRALVALIIITGCYARARCHLPVQY